MGASTAVTQMIMFIAALGIATGLLMGIKAFSDTAEGSFKTQSDGFNNQIKTSIKIELISHDDTEDITSIYAVNRGQTSIKLDDIDVYINGIRFPRSTDNRTIEVIADTETINTGIWDYKEKILIKANMTLNPSISHEATIIGPHGARDDESFSI